MSFHVSGLIHICRSLVRFWGVSLLNIVGLAIGFSAAVIIGLYVRSELTFDRSMPEAEKVYLLSAYYGAVAPPMVASDKTPAGLAQWLRSDAQSVESVARLHPAEGAIRSDRRQNLEHFYWADANIFDLLRLRAVSGDLRHALNEPDSVVLTQAVARRYFGREDVVGRTLQLNTYLPIRISAVLADYPANTNLDRQIFVSSRSGYSMLAILDQNPSWQWASSYTFIRLKPDTHMLPPQIQAIAAAHWLPPHNIPTRFDLIPLLKLHFAPRADGQFKPRGHRDTVIAIGAVAVLILVLAGVNFAGIMTAQIDERRDEMAIRAALGAQRHHLLFHVLGEGAVISLVAVTAALAIVERLLPVINTSLGLELGLWTSAPFICAVGAVLFFTGVLGALFPAIALSRTAHDKAASQETPRRHFLSRIGWVAVQFSLLIILLIASQTVYRQWTFATSKALNFDASRVMLIPIYEGSVESVRFKNDIMSLPGVESAALSRYTPILEGTWPGWAKTPGGTVIQFARHSVDPGFFDLYRVRILAGRTFAGVYGTEDFPKEVILNHSAAKAFGYIQPQDAIGQIFPYQADRRMTNARIIGVVDDMRLTTVREAPRPMVFDNQSRFFSHLSVRLRDRQDMATLAAIDQLWRGENPNNAPLERYFFSDYLAAQYRDMAQQWWAFGLLSIVGVCLSILGLTGLSIYLARARRREIAIRNALGAGIWDIFKLRFEPFIKPLILANVSASLLSWALMTWWLNAFDAHVKLSPLSFIVAGGLTVLIATATLALHAVLSTPARSSQPMH